MATVFKAGHTALITGGASGIGLSLAKRCLEHGMKVLVVDCDEQRLGAVGAGAGGEVATFHMDVSKPDGHFLEGRHHVDMRLWAELKSKVDLDFGAKIHLLALNAGIGPPSSWDDASSFQRTIDTNLFGVIHGVATFLPAVRAAASPEAAAAVVITGSKQGITNPPGNPAYNASKAAVKALAEHLSFDLRHDARVAVHLLVPGWTFTGLTGARVTEDKPSGAWWPDQVVDFLEQKMAEGQFYVLCPDNEVTQDLDRKRMLWGVGDVVEGRPPLSRWRDDWKEQAQKTIAKQ